MRPCGDRGHMEVTWGHALGHMKVTMGHGMRSHGVTLRETTWGVTSDAGGHIDVTWVLHEITYKVWLGIIHVLRESRALGCAFLEQNPSSLSTGNFSYSNLVAYYCLYVHMHVLTCIASRYAYSK